MALSFGNRLHSQRSNARRRHALRPHPLAGHVCAHRRGLPAGRRGRADAGDTTGLCVAALSGRRRGAGGGAARWLADLAGGGARLVRHQPGARPAPRQLRCRPAAAAGHRQPGRCRASLCRRRAGDTLHAPAVDAVRTARPGGFSAGGRGLVLRQCGRGPRRAVAHAHGTDVEPGIQHCDLVGRRPAGCVDRHAGDPELLRSAARGLDAAAQKRGPDLAARDSAAGVRHPAGRELECGAGSRCLRPRRCQRFADVVGPVARAAAGARSDARRVHRLRRSHARRAGAGDPELARIGHLAGRRLERTCAARRRARVRGQGARRGPARLQGVRSPRRGGTGGATRCWRSATSSRCAATTQRLA